MNAVIRKMFFGVAGSLLLLSGLGCATDGSSQAPAKKERVSTTAWSKPESWESQGSLGGMGLGQGR